MSVLQTYRQTLQQWGLNEIPFQATPPEDPKTLRRIFHGRQTELEKGLPALYEGRNVLVRGLWGVGKTTFILYLLDRLQQEMAQLNETALILYIGRFVGETVEDFFLAILGPLAEKLAETEAEARPIRDALSGLQVSRTQQGQVEGKIDLQFFSVGGAWQKGQEQQWQLQNVYTTLVKLLDLTQSRYSKVIIALDDLDKKEPSQAQEMLDSATDLLRRGQGKRAFLLTGRFTSILRDLSEQALGLFSERIELSRMTTDDLRHIAINYLNLARPRMSNALTPFNEATIGQIAEYANHIPRQFNQICDKVMRRAASQGISQIDEAALAQIWPGIQAEFNQELTPGMRRLLHVARRSGGLSPDIEDETLDDLGVETFVELLPMLSELESKDWLIRDESGRLLPSALLPEEE
jgi:hypothetical protein